MSANVQFAVLVVLAPPEGFQEPPVIPSPLTNAPTIRIDTQLPPEANQPTNNNPQIPIKLNKRPPKLTFIGAIKSETTTTYKAASYGGSSSERG